MAAALTRGLTAEGYVVDVCRDGPSGLDAARFGGYDAVLLDLMLPGMSGYTVVRTLREEANWVPVLVLSAKDGEYDQADALDYGADDYLTKPFTKEELLNSINARMEKLEQIRQTQPEKDALIEASLEKITSLTKAERKVLNKIAEGFTTPQIAEKLFVSKKTVENHRVNISRKLDLSGPNSLINFALRLRAQKSTIHFPDNLPAAPSH